jgi:phosphoglycolate phosphatase
VNYTEAYREFFFDPDAPQDLFEGARDTLEHLLGEGYLLAVATGKSRRGLDRVLHELGMESWFHATRCADETSSKPDPRMLHEILSELGLSADRSVMVGDTEYDLAMAAQANMPSVGVSYGVHDKERLMQHQPLAFIDSISELPGILSKLHAKRRA